MSEATTPCRDRACPCPQKIKGRTATRAVPTRARTGADTIEASADVERNA